MSFSSAPEPPPTGLNADAARVQQRQVDDRAARTAPTHHLRPSPPESLHRMVTRVRAAMRARRKAD